MGAWKYVLLDLLFMIPVIGWFFAFCFAIDATQEHENRVRYARAFWCAYS